MFKTLIQILRQKSLMSQALDRTEAALADAERLTGAVLEALLDGKKPGFDVYALDREINQAEVEVRRMIFQHLATNPSTDLAAALIVTSTIIDVERIGDYAKNIYEIAENAKRPFQSGRHFDDVRKVAEDVKAQFGRVAEAMDTANVALGNQVMTGHRSIGPRTEAIIEAIAADEQLSSRDAVNLALAARFLKRISAHLSNLASSVVNPFDRIGFRPDSVTPEDADD